MRLVDQCDAHLSGPKFGFLAVDLKEAPPLQDEKDLVAEVVAVKVTGLASRGETKEPGAYLRSNQNVAQVFLPAEIENFEFHFIGIYGRSCSVAKRNGQKETKRTERVEEEELPTDDSAVP